MTSTASNDSVVHVHIAIAVASEPISGTLTAGGEAAVPFTGWIELTRLLEAARGVPGFGDPDGNGLDLSWDRPPTDWPRTADGRFALVNRPLDTNAPLEEAP